MSPRKASSGARRRDRREGLRAEEAERHVRQVVGRRREVLARASNSGMKVMRPARSKRREW